jgi:peptidoglycan/xylan/chitin deacetylase (PgdA/CDA1 family)
MNDLQAVNICFHGVGTTSRTVESAESPYWIATSTFVAVLDDIMSWPQSHGLMAQLSFDDGNSSDLEIALPALADRGQTAQFFVLAGRLSAAGSLRPADLRELNAAGMTIGTHGMHHRSWRGMDTMTSTIELIDARARIADSVGTPITIAALPMGQYDHRLLASLGRLGYQHVHTSDRDVARRDSWLQPRFSIRAEDSVGSFRTDVLAATAWSRRLERAAVGFIKRHR